MNKIIEELKDIYDVLQKAEFVFDDPTAKGRLYLCHSKLKQIIRTLEARELIDKKEDKKIKRLGKCFFTDYDDIFTEWVAEYNGVIVDRLNEVIDRLNGEDNEDN